MSSQTTPTTTRLSRKRPRQPFIKTPPGSLLSLFEDEEEEWSSNASSSPFISKPKRRGHRNRGTASTSSSPLENRQHARRVKRAKAHLGDNAGDDSDGSADEAWGEGPGESTEAGDDNATNNKNTRIPIGRPWKSPARDSRHPGTVPTSGEAAPPLPDRPKRRVALMQPPPSSTAASVARPPPRRSAAPPPRKRRATPRELASEDDAQDSDDRDSDSSEDDSSEHADGGDDEAWRTLVPAPGTTAECFYDDCTGTKSVHSSTTRFGLKVLEEERQTVVARGKGDSRSKGATSRPATKSLQLVSGEISQAVRDRLRRQPLPGVYIRLEDACTDRLEEATLEHRDATRVAQERAHRLARHCGRLARALGRLREEVGDLERRAAQAPDPYPLHPRLREEDEENPAAAVGCVDPPPRPRQFRAAPKGTLKLVLGKWRLEGGGLAE